MFYRTTDNIAKAMQLLVAMGDFVSAPGAKTGLGVYNSIRKIATHPPRSLTTMARSLTAAAEKTFANWHSAPQNADILFVQMVDVGLLTPDEITAAGMNAEACTVAMLSKIDDQSDPTGEMRSAGMSALFKTIVTPALEPLLQSKEYSSDLTPAFMAQTLQTVQRSERKIDDFADRFETLQFQERETLEMFVLRFGEPAPERMSLRELRDFLVAKAQDYRSLRAEVDEFRRSGLESEALLVEVDERIAGLDFDGARRLVTAARRTSRELLRKPVEDHVRLMEIEARIALLGGRTEQAFTLMSSAADNLALLDPLKPARRRLGYAIALSNYGERYGGPATQMVERMALAILDVADDLEKEFVFRTQNLLGLSLLSQGRYTVGSIGDDLLKRAGDAFSIVKSSEDRGLRAAALDHLTVVRTIETQREASPAQIALLSTAIQNSRTAISLFGDDKQAIAKALNNLGNAQLLLLEHLDGAQIQETLDQAFESFDRSTRLFRDVGDLMNMAGARFGVATVIDRRATLHNNAELRKHAIDEFAKALQFFREREAPEDAAMAAGSLGNALLNQATQAPSEYRVALLISAETAFAEAVDHYRSTEQPLAEIGVLEKHALSEEMRASIASAPEAKELLTSARARVMRALELAGPNVDGTTSGQAIQRIDAKLQAMV